VKLSKIKIIAGKWRGRWIEFPDTQEIRPTPNRVRETLFNWLMMKISGARCLDAFAGSGAVTLEALSRGAASVMAFEKNPNFAAQIKANAIRFAAENLNLQVADFFHSAFVPGTQFDIVFLDPPFQRNLLMPALEILIQNNLLASEHSIYFEVEKQFDLTRLPPEVEILKNQVAGEVRYGLLRVQSR
jgi:16S rRNA (guanine966-N2)-methyltransferase